LCFWCRCSILRLWRLLSLLSEHHRANLRVYFRYSAFSHGFIRSITGYQCQRGIIQLRDTMIKPGVSAATSECNTTPRKNRAQTLPLAFTPSSHTLELSPSSVLIRVPRKAYKHSIVMYHTAALSNWVFWRVWDHREALEGWVERGIS
jgi:hypothetical protein